MWINLKEANTLHNSFAIVKHEGDLAITNDLFKRAILEHFDISEEYAVIPDLTKHTLLMLEGYERLAIRIKVDDKITRIDIEKTWEYS